MNRSNLAYFGATVVIVTISLCLVLKYGRHRQWPLPDRYRVSVAVVTNYVTVTNYVLVPLTVITNK